MKKDYTYGWAVDITEYKADGTHFICDTEIFHDKHEALDFYVEFNKHNNQDPLLKLKQAETPRKVVS